MSGGSNTPDAGQLRAFIERIERVESEIKDRQEDRKEIYSEARGTGFDPKIMKRIIAIRKQDKAKREEEEALIDLYLGALGDLKDTPLGLSAVSRAFGK